MNNKVYDSESVTMTICYFDLTIACMSKHIHSLPWQTEGTIFTMSISPLIGSYAIISSV